MQKFYMERFSLKVSNRFIALENLDDDVDNIDLGKLLERI
jgi:hypothetical protein